MARSQMPVLKKRAAHFPHLKSQKFRSVSKIAARFYLPLLEKRAAHFPHLKSAKFRHVSNIAARFDLPVLRKRAAHFPHLKSAKFRSVSEIAAQKTGRRPVFLIIMCLPLITPRDARHPISRNLRES